jgi:hypothetical protein
MPPFIYRRPNTGYNVQGWDPGDDKSEGANNVFVGVTCLLCGLVHFGHGTMRLDRVERQRACNCCCVTRSRNQPKEQATRQGVGDV